MVKKKDKMLAEWFWCDRWVGSSAFLLNVEARGLYREMLTQAWLRGARLPNDHDAIRRATGTTSAEWKRCWPKVEKYWRVDGDSLVNDTQIEVYKDSKQRSETASDRARRGAESRWGEVKNVDAQALLVQSARKAEADAQALLAECSPSLITRTNTKKRPSVSVRPKEPADPRIKEFLEWFQSEYQERRRGANYLIHWEKDAAIVKRLLKAVGLPELQDDARILLSDKTDDPFIVGSDRGIGILSMKFNWLEDRRAAWKARHRQDVVGAA